jgi:hypothetical protein
MILMACFGTQPASLVANHSFATTSNEFAVEATRASLAALRWRARSTPLA